MLIPKVMIGLLLAVPTPAPTTAPVEAIPRTGTEGTSGPVSGRELVFSEEFEAPISARRWTTTRSSSYSHGNMNPANDKLDIISSKAITVADGRARFTATRSDAPFPLDGKSGYTTGLLTTEYSDDGFRLRAGDYIEARVQLPTERGAWPALWTWRGDGTEVDVFEYHPTNPNLLELVNHVVKPGAFRYVEGKVRPGDWVTIGARIGADNVTWYVDGTAVWSDHRGVGSRWNAYIILNLSVNAGKLHRAPTASTFSMSADWIRVWR